MLCVVGNLFERLHVIANLFLFTWHVVLVVALGLDLFMVAFWLSTLYVLLSVVYVFVVPLKWMSTLNNNKLSWGCNYLWIKLRPA